MDDLLKVEVADSILWITLNRPERGNALTPEMLVQLEDTLKREAGDCRVADFKEGQAAFLEKRLISRFVILYEPTKMLRRPRNLERSFGHFRHGNRRSKEVRHETNGFQEQGGSPGLFG